MTALTSCAQTYDIGNGNLGNDKFLVGKAAFLSIYKRERDERER